MPRRPHLEQGERSRPYLEQQGERSRPYLEHEHLPRRPHLEQVERCSARLPLHLGPRLALGRQEGEHRSLPHHPRHLVRQRHRKDHAQPSPSRCCRPHSCCYCCRDWCEISWDDREWARSLEGCCDSETSVDAFSVLEEQKTNPQSNGIAMNCCVERKGPCAHFLSNSNCFVICLCHNPRLAGCLVRDYQGLFVVACPNRILLIETLSLFSKKSNESRLRVQLLGLI